MLWRDKFYSTYRLVFFLRSLESVHKPAPPLPSPLRCSRANPNEQYELGVDFYFIQISSITDDMIEKFRYGVEQMAAARRANEGSEHHSVATGGGGSGGGWFASFTRRSTPVRFPSSLAARGHVQWGPGWEVQSGDRFLEKSYRREWCCRVNGHLLTWIKYIYSSYHSCSCRSSSRPVSFHVIHTRFQSSLKIYLN